MVVPEFKLVISDPKSGRAKQITLSDPESYALIGLKIGDEIDGSSIGLPGLRLRITGGSDKAGFPMLPYLLGGRKYRILLSGPPGFRPKERGLRRRKMVRGNVITEDIVQVNMVVVEGELKFEESKSRE